MLFSSLLFLTGFLPIAVAGAVFIAKFLGPRAVVAYLAIASFVFYGWHYPPYVSLLGATIAFNFLLAQGISRTHSKAITAGAIIVNLAALAWFKYAGFLDEMVFAIAGVNVGVPAILLPLGISFFTFQQIAYLVDIYQGKTRSGSLLDYVFLVSFFPQLIAGPIVHHKELIPQLSNDRFARFRYEDVAAGVFLFSFGLAKKVLLADNLAVCADTLFRANALAVEISMSEAWLGMLCYTFQIYFDFSGYSDMALGLGLIFGLKLPVNFWSPYKAANIVEFWKRWNITLSAFLRDYLYFPLGGNRSGPVRRYANLWIVMLLGGLWHGAGWQFVFWGALHGFYLTVAHIWARHSRVRIPVLLSRVLTFLCVIVAWVFFRAESFGEAEVIVRAMAGLTSPVAWELAIFESADIALVLVALSGLIVWFMPNAIEISQGSRAVLGSAPTSVVMARIAGAFAAASLFTIYLSGSNAFIYFQF